jgi:RimJ/RimL family protein N-acetyltransferase
VDFLTTHPPEALFAFLQKRVGLAWSTDFVSIGRVLDKTLVGVVGYNNFTGTSCHMHMAGDGGRWMNRAFLKASFGYPFETLGLQLVFGVVPSGNHRALKIDLKLGFEELIYIPGAHPDGGLHILQMRREKCRWLRETYGKEVQSEAA